MKTLTLKSTLTIINVFFLALVSFAQGSIEGTIVDELTEENLPFVNVVLMQEEEIISSTTTDLEGFFFFDNVKEGEYVISLKSFDAFKNYTNIIVADKTLFYAFEFNPANIFDEFDAIAYPTLITKENITTYEADFIDNLGIRNITGVESISPATVETPEGISYKGARPGTAVYYIDGIRTYNDLYIPMSSVNSMEVYSGGIPAQYGNTTSAVIVVESKGYFDIFK